MSLLKSTGVYKPFQFPWAYDYWKKQQQVHWLPEEVPLHEDCKDWNQNLEPSEKNLLTQIFRFFTQADVEVFDCYHSKYSQIFKPVEIKMMLTAFSNMECFDDQSELLTADGWKNVRDITMDDTLAQYDIPTSKISFVKPKKVVSYPYEGIMHHYKSQTSDIMVTPNHDMIARRNSNGEVIKVKSDKLKLGRNYTYPASADTVVPHEDLSSFERLLIAIQADGCLRGNCPSAGEWRTVDFRLRKPRKIERLLDLLEDCGINCSVRNPKGPHEVIITFNLPEGPDIKTIKDFGFVDITKLSGLKAEQIIREVVLWDGTFNKNTGQMTYYTSRKVAADKIQAIASLTGTIMATVGVNRKAGDVVILPTGRFYELTEDHLAVSFVQGRVEKTYPYKQDVQYNGHVYCVSVDTENLVSRRNGKVAFTGNTIHSAAYSHLLDTVGMPESEYAVFMKIKAMRDKHDYMATFGVETDADIAKTLAMFGGFTEGLQLFASFAMLMNFPRFNKMKGMGQIVTWSVRDESLHCEGIIRLFHAFCEERQCLTPSVKDDIISVCKKTVEIEDAFIDTAFELGPVKGMTPEDIKLYIRFIADWRLTQLRLPTIYGIDEHPIQWLIPLLNGVEHSNFFEGRSTNYSRSASRGDWTTTWDMFDKHNEKVALA